MENTVWPKYRGREVRCPKRGPFSDRELVTRAVENATSIAGALHIMGVRLRDTHYAYLRAACVEYGLAIPTKPAKIAGAGRQPGRFANRELVRAAISGSTSYFQILQKLKVGANGKNYSRLEEVAGEYGFTLPVRRQHMRSHDARPRGARVDWSVLEDSDLLHKTLLEYDTICAIVTSLGLRDNDHTRGKLKQAVGALGLTLPNGRVAGGKMTAALKRAKRVPTCTLLDVGALADHSTIRRRIIEDNLLPYTCAICDCDPVWRGRELVLTLDHINGDPSDNRLTNLRFVCPNCDTQTPTFKGRNRQITK